MDKDIASIRRTYGKDHLEEEVAGNDPFLLFDKWFEDAVNSEILDPTAFFLSTVSPQGPDGRIVLLKEVKDNALVFFSNYQSKKGHDMDFDNRVTAVFYWSPFERQVRIHGVAQKLERQESLEYFHSRPREAQIGAWASRQSEEIPSRKELENRFADLQKQYGDGEIPMPEYWGGYKIVPEYFEFWQGRPGRLHDRISFLLEQGNWHRKRLQP